MKIGIHHYFELLSLLVSICYIGKLRSCFLWIFFPYLLFTLSLELTSNYLYNTYHYATDWLYNLPNLISHAFYAYVFYRFSFARDHKRTIVLLSSSYLVFSLLYLFDTAFAFNNYIIAIGGIILILFACLHFYGYLQNDEFVSEAHYSSGLWIASGILVFYSGITICMALFNYIYINKLMVFGKPIFNVIPSYLSVILYSCIAIALIIWKKPATKL